MFKFMFVIPLKEKEWSMNYNEVEILAFKENFSPDVLKKYSGIELLKLLAYPKNPDNNIKEQFKELYEENYNSLKNELENGMTDFGSGSAGFDTNFVLAYRQGSWHNLKKKISFNEAIKIAENIKRELIQACSYLENNNFNEFYNYVSKSTSGLFNKGYTHKYFYILYPKFISFYHAGSWQQYFKECLKLPSSYNFYDIERYFISNYPDCHVGEKSRELEDEYGLPYDSQYWLRSANSSMYDHKGAFDKFGFIDWRQHNKFNVNDIVYIYSSANDKRIRYKTIVEKIDIPFSEINDDHEFWRNEEEYQKSKECKYVRLKLIKEVFNESLSYENLKKLNYIDNVPQGSVKIKNKNFIEFLNSNFGDNKMSDIQKIEKPKHENFALNQILYGPPGTGKTYNTIIEAMKILTFEGLFRDWYIKVYCQNNKVDSKEKTLNDYIKYLTKINEEFLKNDNIFRYHDLSKFVETKSYILNSKYITEDPTKNNKNSYYQHGLKRYEEFLEWLTYDKIKEKYAEYKNLGQIEFVTFHQSYSYEEFVEGIKPDLNSDDLKYILNKGSFRTICDSAKDLQKAKQTYKFNYSNLSLYKILMPYNDLFEYCIENDCVAIGWGEDVNIENCNSEKDLSSAIPENYEHRKQCISQLNMFKLWIDKDLKEGKDVIAIIPGSMNTIKGIAKITGNYSYNAEIENGQQQRKAEWLKKDINIPSDYIYSSKFVSPTITGMFKDKINEDNLMKLLNNASDQKSKNAVLIIDEINRGNISKIFGELITLIEEDKRDNMEVTLPYSKLPFSVPNNLYIIGTMNTSDRSIASIDIALRRRFKFKEMMPNSSLVADFGIGFNKIFDDLNNKIKLLLDRDHQIGHSYFINTKYNNNNENNNVETLKDIWFSEILPLLNEYFYCDWEKLKLIIPGFIKKLDVPEVLKNECDDSIYEFKTFDEVEYFEKTLNQEKFEQV